MEFSDWWIVMVANFCMGMEGNKYCVDGEYRVDI